MPERALSSMTWRQQHPTEIELVFENGEKETITGTHREAARMAREAELRLAPSPLGMTRWMRDSPRAGGKTPKRIGPWLSN